jgi:hypothetical protein
LVSWITQGIVTAMSFHWTIDLILKTFARSKKRQ